MIRQIRLSAAVCLMCAALCAGAPGEGVMIRWHPRHSISLTNPASGDTLYPINVNNWWGYMNQRGRLVVFPRLQWADDFYDGLARAVFEGKTGFVKGNGEWTLPAVYLYADRFSQGRAVVGDGEHFGFIEKSGRLVVPVQFDGALRFREGLAGVCKDGLCGFVGVSGRLEIPMRFTRVRSFHDGFAAVQWPVAGGAAGGGAGGGQDEHVGYIDRRGKVVYQAPRGAVNELGDFNDGLARVRSGEKWGYLGKSWKLRIDARFDEARDFTNGLAAVRVGQKWGYINKVGDFVIEPTLDAADDFDDTLAMITIDGKVGYVNRTGRQGIHTQFDHARPFLRNYARVAREPSFGYVTLSGSVVWDPQETVRGFVNNRSKERAVVQQYDSVTHNRVVSPPQYREPIPEPYPPDHLYEESLRAYPVK